MNKKELRKKYREIRKNIINKDIKNKLVYKNFIETQEYMESECIGFYKSFNDEVDTTELIKKALADHKKVSLPRIIDAHKMVFIEINADTRYELNVYGIAEPIGNEMAKNEIDLFVCPGLVFDKGGYRIGYGKGYYDQYLKHLNSIKIGLCFAEQLIDQIDHDEYDVKMNKVITEDDTNY